MNPNTAIAFAMFVAALALGSAPASAQGDYPNRAIRLIAPSPPAGVHDVIGRLWGERIKPLLGTIVVENRPGAGTLIGVAEAVKSDADVNRHPTLPLASMTASP